LILSDDDVLRLDRHLANRDTCQNPKKPEKRRNYYRCIGRLGPTAGAI
jgi:hypothetical protein